MRTMVANGRLSLIAETPAEGFELAEMVLEARLTGSYIKTHRNGDGGLGISVRLHDMEMARLIGEYPKDE